MMKRVGGTDVSDLLLVGGVLSLLFYSTLMTADFALRLLCMAVFLFFLLSRRKTKTVKAQLIEIVDETGASRACIGYTGLGLSIGISKKDFQNNAFVPYELFQEDDFVQFTFGTNLGSTHQPSDKTALIQITDTNRNKVFRVGLEYPRDQPAEVKRIYCEEDVS